MNVDVSQLLGGGNPGLRAEDPIVITEPVIIEKTPEPNQDPIPSPANPDPIEPASDAVPSSADPVPEPTPEEDKTKDLKEDPVTNKEIKEIEEVALEKEEQKKEEILEDTKDTSEEYKQQVFEMLIEEQTKLEIDLEKEKKSNKYYKQEYEKLMKEHNALKYDDRKVAISDEHRPIIRLLEQYKQTPDSEDIQRRLLVQLFETATWITGEDYRNAIRQHYEKNSQKVNNLSQNISTYSNIPVVSQDRKSTGILRNVNSNKRF